MNKKEFEDKTNLFDVTEQEFEEANNLYMMIDNMDKDEFCKEYVLANTNPLFNKVTEELKRYKDKADEARTVAYSLIEFSCIQDEDGVYINKKIYRQALGLIDIKSAVSYKIGHKLPLFTQDYDYLERNLISMKD